MFYDRLGFKISDVSNDYCPMQLLSTINKTAVGQKLWDKLCPLQLSEKGQSRCKNRLSPITADNQALIKELEDSKLTGLDRHILKTPALLLQDRQQRIVYSFTHTCGNKVMDAFQDDCWFCHND